MERNVFNLFIKLLFEEIVVIPSFAISKDNREQAYKLCKDIDEKDAPFVAFALEYKLSIWTNDLKLIAGLKNKGFDSFIDTRDIFL